jgi:hypothetical protein
MTDAELAALNRTPVKLGLRPLRPPPAEPRTELEDHCRCASEAAAQRGMLVRHYETTLEVY